MKVDERIAKICQQAIEEQTFPGCVVGYIQPSMDKPVILPFGQLTYETEAPAVTADTVYDVASITKSVPTSSIILKLVEDGRLGLPDKVIDYVPEIQNDYRDQILIRHLLTFTVTFNLGRSLASVAQEEPSRLLEVLFAAPLADPPGTKCVYTNAPALILGLVAERVCKQPLDEIAQRMFFEPLNMRHTTFRAETLPADEVAPSGVDWRGEVRGVVHDPGAWALRQDGRIPGHAGLFSTAGDLLTFGRMLLNGGELGGRRYFKPETVRLMHTSQLAGIGERVSLGWALTQSMLMADSTGTPEGFGKTGFTGTMILVDPVKQIASVLLSNRTYPRSPASHEAWRAIRGELDAVIFGD